MPMNWKLQRHGGFSNSSNFANDNVDVEVMKQLKMKSSDNNGGSVDDEYPGQFVYPERPGEPDCLYYLRAGVCGYGSNCRFNHPYNAGKQVYGVKNAGELRERSGHPDCKFYMNTGTCKYGSACKYHHTKNRQTDSLVLLNIVGLPMRQDTKPCLHYMRTGLCKYGYACMFHHPQPTTAANVPVPVSDYGGTAVFPSFSAPSGSLLPMPVYLSPPQGWNMYMGNVNPLSVTTFPTAPAFNCQLSGSYLPERPNQPNCRYFMNNVSCKYGPDCKYHHPIEKISQLPPSSLGPLGLPLRPGHPICSYYSYYGICQYGSTCGFDHPLDGYSYAYNLSIPPLTATYSPPIPYQKTTSPVPSAELSPSNSPNEWTAKCVKADNNSQDLDAKSISPNSLPSSSTMSSELLRNESALNSTTH